MNATDIKKVACTGSVLMGSSFATNFAMRGYDVCVFNLRKPRLEEAREIIHSNLSFLAQKEILADADVSDIEARVRYTTDIKEAVEDVQFIQEQFPEKYEVKREMLSEVEKYTSPESIIASSTSGLLITEIQKGLKYPERVVGGHPFNPPHLIPLVEVVKGERTSNQTVKCAYDFYKLLGKEPVILHKEVSGFIANRLLAALHRECTDLVMNGVCTVEDVDKAFTFGPGLRMAIMGPNLVLHLGGGKVGGIRSLMSALHDSNAARLEEMARWTTEPEEWPDIAEEGVLKEIENRSPSEGRTIEEIARYRDDMLIEILRLHKKL